MQFNVYIIYLFLYLCKCLKFLLFFFIGFSPIRVQILRVSIAVRSSNYESKNVTFIRAFQTRSRDGTYTIILIAGLRTAACRAEVELRHDPAA